MASVSLLLVISFLVLGAKVMCLNNNSYPTNGDMVMEVEELIGLYEVLGSLLEDSTWAQMHPQPCTDTPWPGLECEVTEAYPPIFHVTKIHIGPDILTPPCKTNAKLSQSFQKLPYLKTLSLFNCFVKSPITLSPNLFGATFSSLNHFALVSNPSLSGVIPSKLAEITSLRVLCLSQNNLVGEIPKEIGGLVNLEQLDLSHNHLNGLIPEELGGLSSLGILDLSWNSLEGHVPLNLGKLQFLQKIDLGSNKLQGRVPSDLGQLKRLVLLDLSHNVISGPIPETLSGLQKVEYLMMEDNPIMTRIPLFLGALSKLKVVSLSKCGLIGPIPITISNLKNLNSLSLDNNSLSGTVPPNLGTLLNLDQLNLSQNKLSGELLFPQEFINRLGERLDVGGNFGLYTKQHVYKNKTLSTNLEAPCLDTSTTIANNNQTWGDQEQNPDNCKRLKPSWYNGERSSKTSEVDQKLVLLSLLVCFTTWPSFCNFVHYLSF